MPTYPLVPLSILFPFEMLTYPPLVPLSILFPLGCLHIYPLVPLSILFPLRCLHILLVHPPSYSPSEMSTQGGICKGKRGNFPWSLVWSKKNSITFSYLPMVWQNSTPHWSRLQIPPRVYISSILFPSLGYLVFHPLSYPLLGCLHISCSTLWLIGPYQFFCFFSLHPLIPAWSCWVSR